MGLQSSADWCWQRMKVLPARCSRCQMRYLPTLPQRSHSLLTSEEFGKVITSSTSVLVESYYKHLVPPWKIFSIILVFSRNLDLNVSCRGMRFCCCCCCFSDLLQVRSCSLQLRLQERQHWADLEVGEDLSPNSWKALPSLCCDPGYPCKKGLQLFLPRLGVTYGKIKLGVSRGLSEPNPSFV